jgi:hypothetical protein
MWTPLRIGTVALLTLAMTAVPMQAQSRPGGWHHHHGHGHGHWRFGLGIGFGFGVPLYPYGPYPGHVIVEPAPTRAMPESVPLAPSPPDPVLTPRNGQDAARTEGDRQACNRVATTQPSAMADAGVFHHTVLACMESRGYSVR